MCTLVFGRDVFGPGTIVLATNRDEDPARGSEGPQVLRDAPRIAGGRDRVAGGTWLALRAPAAGRPAGVAMLLNRRDPDPGAPGRRSRGLLTLDVAAADDPLVCARAEAATGRYAPCSLVWLAPDAAWLLAIRAGEPATVEPIAPGWHALSHFELDDPADARTAWLAERLRAFAPADREAAERGLHALVTAHGEGGTPAVCLHAGRAPTVSSARVAIDPAGVRWAHAPGPPCTTPFADASGLLAP